MNTQEIDWTGEEWRDTAMDALDRARDRHEPVVLFALRDDLSALGTWCRCCGDMVEGTQPLLLALPDGRVFRVGEMVITNEPVSADEMIGLAETLMDDIRETQGGRG